MFDVEFEVEVVDVEEMEVEDRRRRWKRGGKE